jgi:hypothetical protein
MEIKEVTKNITKTIYVANDGLEFEHEYECINYESEKTQQKLEKEADDKIRIYPKSNLPSMIDTRNNHEYRYFLIKNEDDLDLFIKAYTYWFSNLKKLWQVDKDVFIYPEILCILDFPQGPEDYRLYKLTQLIYQFNYFTDEIDDITYPLLNDMKTNESELKYEN